MIFLLWDILIYYSSTRLNHWHTTLNSYQTTLAVLLAFLNTVWEDIAHFYCHSTITLITST